jgi:hypothetical protein
MFGGMYMFNPIAGLSVLLLILSLTPNFYNMDLDKWLAMRPLLTKRADIEKMYGKPEEAYDKHQVIYETKDGAVTVTYSYGPCRTAKIPEFDVPEWTVTEIMFSPWKSPPNLADLIGDGHGFDRTPTGDVEHQVKYSDNKNGISIVIDDYEKKVKDIVIGLSQIDHDRLRCKNTGESDF